ncbi:unnamed protein product, partial [Polarella glacialis]
VATKFVALIVLGALTTRVSASGSTSRKKLCLLQLEVAHVAPGTQSSSKAGALQSHSEDPHSQSSTTWARRRHRSFTKGPTTKMVGPSQGNSFIGKETLLGTTEPVIEEVMPNDPVVVGNASHLLLEMLAAVDPGHLLLETDATVDPGGKDVADSGFTPALVIIGLFTLILALCVIVVRNGMEPGLGPTQEQRPTPTGKMPVVRCPAPTAATAAAVMRAAE